MQLRTENTSSSKVKKSKSGLKRAIIFFKTLGWLSIAYAVVVITFNWIVRSKMPTIAENSIKMGIISSVVVMLQGLIGMGVFFSVAEMAKALMHIERRIPEAQNPAEHKE